MHGADNLEQQSPKSKSQAIVNSGPMTTQTISDVENVIPLSPSNFLIIKSKTILPFPFCFSSSGNYYQKCWGRVQQHMVNEFWFR